MSAHCSLEALSSYVDAELSAEDRGAVELHVRDCSDCRSRLRHLEKVVGQLRRLEEVAAPPTLGFGVARRVRLERGRQPWSSRLEDGLGRLTRQPLFAPMFALVIAFGVIFYVFSVGVAHYDTSSTRVVIGGRPAGDIGLGRETEDAGSAEAGVSSIESAEPARQRAAAPVPSPAGVESRRRQTRSDEESLSTHPLPVTEVEAQIDAAKAAVGAAVAADADGTLEVGSRRFRLRDGIWVEEGVGTRVPSAVLDLGARGAQLPAGLESLSERAGTFWVLDGGPGAADSEPTRILEIRVP